jgi:hypothetical protein
MQLPFAFNFGRFYRFWFEWGGLQNDRRRLSMGQMISSLFFGLSGISAKLSSPRIGGNRRLIDILIHRQKQRKKLSVS